MLEEHSFFSPINMCFLSAQITHFDQISFQHNMGALREMVLRSSVGLIVGSSVSSIFTILATSISNDKNIE